TTLAGIRRTVESSRDFADWTSEQFKNGGALLFRRILLFSLFFLATKIGQPIFLDDSLTPIPFCYKIYHLSHTMIYSQQHRVVPTINKLEANLYWDCPDFTFDFP